MNCNGGSSTVSRENNPGYREQKDPRDHAERQRARIERFIEQAGTGIEFLSPGKVMAILASRLILYLS